MWALQRNLPWKSWWKDYRCRLDMYLFLENKVVYSPFVLFKLEIWHLIHIISDVFEIDHQYFITFICCFALAWLDISSLCSELMSCIARANWLNFLKLRAIIVSATKHWLLIDRLRTLTSLSELPEGGWGAPPHRRRRERGTALL